MKKPIPFGKYYLLERINVGGMAEVFRAKAYGVEGFERLVAVKRILPNIAEDKEFIKMFIDEAKIAVQLNHANIAQIFDLGMVDGSYYIALEHVHGRDLRAIFDRCRNLGEPMPIAQACFMVMKVCEGLDYAHNKRDPAGRGIDLVHRDVSPQNVLVSFEGEVKLIDFGIAKAAGKGSKTQAGILKGKFGYMSPEQVRGLPVDRRSDIFACGIVLYELLTGERLFVGESDFSTLEKVRNVEILPPSTYNRRIPDELERIVLKALAKDVEDRYQNSIDLHDELQAFVYTAGEFYSRKDLAGWMKKVFAKEIEDESTKLEGYRRLRPPEVRGVPSRDKRMTRPEMPAAMNPKSTLALPTMAPPPPPRGNGASTPAPAMRAATPAADPLEWDDDELETQIYDNPPESGQPGSPGGRSPSGPMPAFGGQAPSTVNPQPMGASGTYGPTGGMGGGAGMGAAVAEPDLSSLVHSARGWDGAAPPPAPPQRASSQQPAMPASLAIGSNKAPSPYPPDHMHMEGPPAAAEEPSAVVRLVNMAQPIFADPFGQPQVAPMVDRRSRKGLLIAAIIAGLLLIGGAVALVIALSGSGGDEEQAGTSDAPAPGGIAERGGDPPAKSGQPAGGAAPAVVLPQEVLERTGFDLYVEPRAISDKITVRVDGKLYATPLPAKFRKLTPGEHKIELVAPAPYGTRSEIIQVVEGRAAPVTIRFDAAEVVTRFESTPSGADVTLISDGVKTPLGKSPITAKLDPSKRYEVVYEKDGYVSQTKPVELSGKAEETVAAVLGRAPAVAVRDAKPPRDPRPPRDVKPPPKDPRDVKPPPKDPPPKDPPPKDPPPKDPPADDEGGEGIVNLGAKPPCQIFIDGKATGRQTPLRGHKLSAGKHKVTLVNNEHNIKETFTVTVKAGQTTSVMKDMMDRVKP